MKQRAASSKRRPHLLLAPAMVRHLSTVPHAMSRFARERRVFFIEEAIHQDRALQSGGAEPATTWE